MFFSVHPAPLRFILANQSLLRVFLHRQDLIEEELWQKISGLIVWLNIGVSHSA